MQSVKAVRSHLYFCARGLLRMGGGYKKKRTSERKPLGPCRNWIALLHVNSRGSLPFPFSRQYSQVGLLTQLDMLLATGGSVSFLQPLHPPTLLALLSVFPNNICFSCRRHRNQMSSRHKSRRLPPLFLHRGCVHNTCVRVGSSPCIQRIRPL